MKPTETIVTKQWGSPTQTPKTEAPELSKLFSEEWERRWLQIDTYHPKLADLQREVESFCRNVLRRNPTTLTIIGDTGTAKTHSLKKVAKFLRSAGFWAYELGLWPRPISTSYFDWAAICTLDREDDDNSFTEANEADVLLLDDIGSEIDKFKTREPVERLRQLLGNREQKYQMITTNIPCENWAKIWDARVEDRLLRGNSKFVDLTGVKRYSERQV